MAQGAANGGSPIGIGETGTLAYWLNPLVVEGGPAYNPSTNVLDIILPNSPIVNVKNAPYNAVGDGITDDTVAIQLAINSFNSSSPGGTVFFPAGVYKISDALTCTTFHIQLLGASRTDCVLKTNHVSANMLEFNSWYCSVKEMTFDSSVTRIGGYAVKMTTGNNRHVVERCEFNNMWGGVLMSSHISEVVNCEFRTFVAGGSWMELNCTASSAHDFRIFGITADNGSNLAGSSGIHLIQCASLLLNTCSLIKAGTLGALYFNPGASQVIPSVYCADVFFDQSGYGANFAGNVTGTTQRIKFVSCWFTQSTNDGVIFNSPNSGGIQGVDFISCDFYGNTNGINAAAGYQDWNVSSSRFAGNTTTGVRTTALATGTFGLNNNFIGNCSGFGNNALGINIQAGTYGGYVIRGNRGLAANTTPGITDNGTVTGQSQKVTNDNLGAIIQGRLASIVANTAAINTTETIVVGGLNNLPIPANSLQIGDTFRVTLRGTCTSSAANASIFVLRFGTAGTVAGDAIMYTATTTVLAAISGTNIPFSAEILFTIRTLGAAATMTGKLIVTNHGTAADAAALGIQTTNTQLIVGTPSTFNTTVANYLEATYRCAATTTTCTFQEALVEKL